MTTISQLRDSVSRLFASRRHARDVRDVFADWWRAIADHPVRRERAIMFAKFGLPPLVLVAAISAFFILRPIPKPDYATADIAKLFDFTFLTSEFNRLPVDERLELIGMLIKRMNSMSAGESVILAGFAAGVAGKAREQIEENASRLMIDLWDKYAIDYAAIPTEDRGAFLDVTMLDLMKTMEAMGGRPRDISDSDRLAEIQRQSKRDAEAMRSGQGPPPQALGRMFGYMRDNVGERANPAQRVRAQQLMVDMTRRARGEPLTGRR
jgi:hypothetical protein